MKFIGVGTRGLDITITIFLFSIFSSIALPTPLKLTYKGKFELFIR